ncbi:hypothetical protein C8K30_103172 [Promicromonospora sp. AC04]|uniref:hypothetical protein n=1 Tax=Promicromonospora sp. AC04 TaxID=2135723 RepID=UPI000D4546FB|nr:hypothetical protein [Promicromonospora sp. AC04]PUB28751.1 hypothetical protein C8K30_103172 [Promicromonospora sp. AC04]
MKLREAFARPNPSVVRGSRAAARAASLTVTTLVGSTLVASGAAAMAVGPTVSTQAAEQISSSLLAAAAELPGAATDVAFTDGVVFVQVSDNAIYWRNQTGGEWSRTWGGTELTGELVAAEADVVQIDQGETDLLVWTRGGGGSRPVPSDTILGHGAQYVGFLDPVNGPTVQTVTSDQVMPAIQLGPAEGNDGMAISGADLVTMTDGGVQFTDISTGTVVARVATCGSSGTTTNILGDTRSRFAFASCNSSPPTVVDGDRIYVRTGLGTTLKADFLGGEGFVLGTLRSAEELTVLSAFGGAAGSLGQVTSFDLDDDATAVAFVDAAGDVRSADLHEWTIDRATEIHDETSPVSLNVTVDGTWTAAGSGVSVSRNYRVQGAAVDSGTIPFRAIGIATQELRYRQKLFGSSTYGDYVQVGAESAVVTSAPPGSRRCWSVRATDMAGNESGWSATEKCVAIDGTKPTASVAAAPSAVKATATATPVTFKYSATDNGAVASYDIRYHKDPNGGSIGPWVYPSTGQGITAKSFTVGTGKSYRVCFSVRARDAAGNLSAWTGSRCTYVDGTGPKITSAALDRWLPSTYDYAWSPTFRYAAQDDRGVAAYQLQTRFAQDAGMLSTDAPLWAWGENKGTSLDMGLDPSEQGCARVRAKDAVGNVGAWSSWRCSNAPFLHWNLTHGGNLTTLVQSGLSTVTEDRVAVRTVRFRYNAGPSSGSMKVYIGDRYMGSVNARSSTSTVRTAQFSLPSVAIAKVRFVSSSSSPVRLRELYFVR